MITNIDELPAFLTVAQYAEIMQTSDDSIYTAIRYKQIPEWAVHRIGRMIRIDKRVLALPSDNRQSPLDL